jgi:hypothetical protein
MTPNVQHFEKPVSADENTGFPNPASPNYDPYILHGTPFDSLVPNPEPVRDRTINPPSDPYQRNP